MKNEMKASSKRLMRFLKRAYIDNPEMGSPTMSTAIRDCLTDMLHIGDHVGLNIRSRLKDAQEVYEEELTLEVEHKTGVSEPR